MLLHVLALRQEKAQREHDFAWTLKEFFLLKFENRLLKSKERIDVQLAAIESTNRINRNQSLESRIEFLRSENQLLNERNLLEEELQDVAQKIAQLPIDRSNAKPIIRGGYLLDSG
jgi:hypothetical protein